MEALLVVFSVLALHLAAGQVQEIAFSAGLTHNQALSVGHSVIYNRIFVNFGGAYNPKNGIFTCPRNGTYVFQYHALSRTDSVVYLELYVNNNYIDSAYGHTASDYASASNSAILQLAKGDHVTLKAAGQNQVNLYGFSGEVYSTFSGYLISAV